MSYTPITAEQAREIYRANIPDISPVMEQIMGMIRDHAVSGEHCHGPLAVNIRKLCEKDSMEEAVILELMSLGYMVKKFERGDLNEVTIYYFGQP